MTKEPFIYDENFVNGKIDEYNKIIANELYSEVSKRFKEQILSEYNNYTSITEELLEQILSESKFRDLCFSDIGFASRESESFWIEQLVDSFKKQIDFKKLKEYENSQIISETLEKNNKSIRQLLSSINVFSRDDNSNIDFVSIEYYTDCQSSISVNAYIESAFEYDKFPSENLEFYLQNENQILV